MLKNQYTFLKSLKFFPSLSAGKKVSDEFYKRIGTERSYKSQPLEKDRYNYHSKRTGIVPTHTYKLFQKISKFYDYHLEEEDFSGSLSLSSIKLMPGSDLEKKQLKRGIRPTERFISNFIDNSKINNHDFVCFEAEMPIGLGMSGSSNLALTLFFTNV